MNSKWANWERVWIAAKDVLKRNKYLIVYDLETTGKSNTNDRIIQIAAVRFQINSDFSLVYVDELVKMINPGFLISEKITEITGITNDMLVDKPSEADVFDEIMEFFRDYPVAGYNNRTFDNHFMENYYARQGVEWIPDGVVDAIEFTKAMLRTPEDVENRQLKTVGNYFGIEFRAHDARNDTMATAEILKILLRECVDAENKNATKPVTKTVKPIVKAVNFWKGYKGFSRIYVETTAGKFYYDLRNYCWGSNSADLDMVDMKYLEAAAWAAAGCSSEEEFKRFRGKAS